MRRRRGRLRGLGMLMLMRGRDRERWLGELGPLLRRSCRILSRIVRLVGLWCSGELMTIREGLRDLMEVEEDS